ncbi:protocatechuate 3,4-dioxygenase beta subunit [Candidatus Scalindua japonica]|uniref:Protocatechuate 3,4-dioxygenase beta subunit n=1 Tax=Candidatus Scalindua japonica TaxID=1284222 RepID=A0A286U2T3_9BACT|nr:carboxypeptidase-like regulatory domain-containing protein [Candidatus Scalindua japonica]GAX62435.1 protocatechuate 3,4-dioxygenase beta subunit [Candidatus Scalindua japonica]
MTYKFICISLIVLLTICTKLYADTLRVEDFNEEINVKILEMNEEYVKAIVPEKVIGSISIKSEPDQKYSDTVFIKANGKKRMIICKIKKITKKPGSVTIQIPREKVVAIQIEFPGSEQDSESDWGDILSTREKGREHVPVDAERLKEKIKEELMSELKKKHNRKDAEIEEKIKDELTVEFERKQQIKEDMFEAENYGKVSGRMLNKGKPLPGCQVKITLLEKWGLFGKPREGKWFEAITDEKGHYFFEKVPPGGYKLYWKPPGESSWIRSIKMEPDFFVEIGETSSVFDRETNIRTIN